MNKTLKLCLLGLIAGSVLLSAGCNKLKARDQLNKGVRAYKSAQFNEAIEHFKTAIQLDPTLVNAKLYLATAYQTQFIPGAPSDDNVKMGQAAVDEYNDVLSSNPNNANAVAGLASLYYGMGKLDEARTYYNKQLQLSPSDPIPYYSIGVIDWLQTYKPRMTLRAKLGIADAMKPLAPKGAKKDVLQACQDLKQSNDPKVEDGIQQLNKALQLRPDYADAMQYMNLLYREKADIECGDDDARTTDLNAADDWVNKALAARKAEEAKNAAKAAQGGITVQSH